MDPQAGAAGAAAPKPLTAADLNYSSDLVNLFVSLQSLAQGRNTGTVAAKRHIFSQFRDRLGPEPDEELCFAVYRLILPELDKVRRCERPVCRRASSPPRASPRLSLRSGRCTS